MSEENKIICRKKDGSPITVMIVDDSQFMRNQIKNIMKLLEIDVCFEAQNGKIAVDNYLKYKPDFVTMDITMPYLNGLEALKKLKEIDGSVKIIMITAISHKEKVKECIINGAINFIVKPFKKEDAVQKLYESMKKINLTV